MHARFDRGNVRLLTRTGLDWTGKYPAIAAALRTVPAHTAPETAASGSRPNDSTASSSSSLGWTDPDGSRPFIGALLLGYYNANGQLIYAGRVGTGMRADQLAEFLGSWSRCRSPRCRST